VLKIIQARGFGAARVGIGSDVLKLMRSGEIARTQAGAGSHSAKKCVRY
jgi:hypothetical protein